MCSVALARGLQMASDTMEKSFHEVVRINLRRDGRLHSEGQHMQRMLLSPA